MTTPGPSRSVDETQHHVIGLVGGLSWQSTALYYQLINRSMQRLIS